MTKRAQVAQFVQACFLADPLTEINSSEMTEFFGFECARLVSRMAEQGILHFERTYNKPVMNAENKVRGGVLLNIYSINEEFLNNLKKLDDNKWRRRYTKYGAGLDVSLDSLTANWGM